MKRLKRSKIVIVAVISIVLVISAVVVFFGPEDTALVSRYQDADGWVYECSKPLAAKEGTATTLGHPQGLVPVSSSEADEYCYKVGIE